MALSILTNLNSLRAQRELAKNDTNLQKATERLSSGLRINDASDDAAALAVSMRLKGDSKVYTQGIRNTNDAISLMNIVDGAVDSLTNIAQRITELAQQAMNGTLSTSQRSALDSEAQSLRGEWNRIADSTKFNGQAVINGQFSGSFQQGYSALSVALGNNLNRGVGDGTFKTDVNYAAGNGNQAGIAAGDLNGDGRDDIVIGFNTTTHGVQVILSNSDGTLNAPTQYGLNTIRDQTVKLVDVNNDGKLDIVGAYDNSGVAGSVRYGISVMLGTGTGTFSSEVTYDIGTTGTSVMVDIDIGDMNGDGYVDVAAVDVNSGSSTATIFTNSGSGTFTAARSFPLANAIDSSNIQGRVLLRDFTGDGNLDIAVAERASGVLQVFRGNGDATFTASTTTTFSNLNSMESADVDGDGVLDIVTASAGNVSVLIGNSNGTFSVGFSGVLGGGASSADIELRDLNEDGAYDAVVAGSNSTYVMLGNTNGTFKVVTSYASTANVKGVTFGDFDGNGAYEIASTAQSSANFNTFMSNSAYTTRLERIDLTTATRAGSALNTMNNVLTRIQKEVGYIGAIERRLQVSRNVLSVVNEITIAANERIEGIDAAEEAANMIALKIRQDSTTAILAQANQTPNIALQILQGTL